MTIFDIDASLAATKRQNAEGMVKIEEDLVRYRALFHRSNPDLIVECGTFSGRSACWLARETGAKVLTIDVSAAHVDLATRAEAHALGVTFVTGSSTDPAIWVIVDAYARHARNPMVVLDSDHSAGHVAAEMAMYGPYVKEGGYMVVEDGIVRWMTGEPYVGSPLDSIEEWLVAHPLSWMVDRELCDRYPVSMHPDGFLRRV